MKAEETETPVAPVLLDGQTVQGVYYALNNICVPKGVFSDEELEVVNILLNNMMQAFDAAQAGIEPEIEEIFDEAEDIEEDIDEDPTGD